MRGGFLAAFGAFLILAFATPVFAAQATAVVQASGDLTLTFGILHEIDFEVRDNYDLDNGLTDGCSRAAVTGNDCSGAAASRDGFVEQETRLIVQGSQGDIWKARVVLEAEEMWEPERFDTLGVERAWADIKISALDPTGVLWKEPFHVKVGLFWDRLEPFRLVYSDDDTGVKAYGAHGNIAWALWWIKETEVSNSTGPGSVFDPLVGGADTAAGRDGDQDYYMARLSLNFGSVQLHPTLGFVRNRNTIRDGRFAVGSPSQDASGAQVHNFRRCNRDSFVQFAGINNIFWCAADETVAYPGLTAVGRMGPVSFIGEVFGAFGEIGDSSAVDAQREQDVAAFMAALDVGVRLGAWTPHAGIIYMSGDDNPHDDDAEAWAPISSDNENLLGSRGILMDDRMEVLGMADDSLTAEEGSPAARFYGLQPGIIALFVGLKGRPTKKIRTDLNLVYFQWDMEKQWEYVDGMVSTTNCVPNQTLSQQGVCSNNNFTNGVADGTGLVSSVDDEVGWELNGAVTYDYNKHVRLTVSAAVFWPGDGAEVVAQCANFSGGTDAGWLLGGSASTGCGGVGTQTTLTTYTQAAEGGADIERVHGIGRADDEAFNVEVELAVSF